MPEAIVRSEMPATFVQMRTQDIRWEASQGSQSTGRTARSLLKAGIRHKDFVRIEAIAELLTPPLSYLVSSCPGGMRWFIAPVVLARFAYQCDTPWRVDLLHWHRFCSFTSTSDCASGAFVSTSFYALETVGCSDTQKRQKIYG